MSEKSPGEQKLSELIVEVLNLEDVSADEIGAEEPLFGDGLELDEGSLRAARVFAAAPLREVVHQSSVTFALDAWYTNR